MRLKRRLSFDGSPRKPGVLIATIATTAESEHRVSGMDSLDEQVATFPDR